MKTTLSALAIAALMPVAAAAHEYTLGDLIIDHPIAFETAPGAQAGGGYLTITNNGDTAQQLVGAAADFPAVQLHLSTEVDGVMRMEQQDAIEIGAGETVALQPGGYHVMFMGLGDDRFEVGEEIPATLEFEGLGAVEIVFNVEERGEMDHGSMDHSDMGEMEGHDDMGDHDGMMDMEDGE